MIKIFVLSIFEWPFYTGFTVCGKLPSSVGLAKMFPLEIGARIIKPIFKEFYIYPKTLSSVNLTGSITRVNVNITWIKGSI